MQSSTRRISGSARARRTHSVMVGAQVALTLLMLTAASAAGKGFLKLVKADLGYDPHFAMSVPIPIHENTHNSWKERSEYFDQLRAGRGLPAGSPWLLFPRTPHRLRMASTTG